MEDTVKERLKQLLVEIADNALEIPATEADLDYILSHIERLAQVGIKLLDKE